MPEHANAARSMRTEPCLTEASRVQPFVQPSVTLTAGIARHPYTRGQEHRDDPARAIDSYAGLAGNGAGSLRRSIDRYGYMSRVTTHAA